MNVVFVTPAWRRIDVTRVALAQRAVLCDELAGRGHEATCVVVADDENLDVAKDHGFHTVEQTNDLLGRKFNDGIEHACRVLGADLVVVIGSDDWLHIDMFDRLPDPHPPMPEPDDENPVVTWNGAPEIITGREIAMVDLDAAVLRRCRAGGRSGSIPWLIPRAALERSGFRPVKDTQMIGIDFSLVIGLGVRPSWVFVDPHDLCRVDFKSAVNLNTWRHVTDTLGYGPVETDPWSLLATRYGDELAGLARATSGQLAVAA